MGRRGPQPKDEELNELGRSVEEHPLFPQILDLLRRRFSAPAVLRALRGEHAAELRTMPPLPSVSTLQRYRSQKMPAKELLPASLLQTKLRQLEMRVDMGNSLQGLYQLAEDRAVRAFKTEEGLPQPIPGTDRALQTVIKLAELICRVGRDLGLHPRPGASLQEANEGDQRTVVIQFESGGQRTIGRLADFETLSDYELQQIADGKVQYLEGGVLPGQGEKAEGA
jgi:hypothetical protein